jgi:wyosine [tRNA(Phe)-imidazoG37] synthetase (radical SAM superfamily)
MRLGTQLANNGSKEEISYYLPHKLTFPLQSTMQVLPLQTGIIYGIVRSRRLRSSLGINLSPTAQKLCSFNCVYCHYGFTDILRNSADGYLGLFPSPEAVEDALRNRLATMEERPLYITFSGNGEPSMHPDFPEIVDRVIKVRNELVPDVKTAILSNGSAAHIPEIQEAILRLDAPIMKLDAGDLFTFRKVNRIAKGVDFEIMTAALADMSGITLQTCMFTGSISNSEPIHIQTWIDRIRAISPREVQIYTIDRPPADGGLQPVARDRLESIVKQAKVETGIQFQLFGHRKSTA